MKNYLYKIGLVFIASLLVVSCSTDDMENEENTNMKYKIQSETSLQVLDSTKIKTGSLYTEDDGDPSNPKPPRR